MTAAIIHRQPLPATPAPADAAAHAPPPGQPDLPAPRSEPLRRPPTEPAPAALAADLPQQLGIVIRPACAADVAGVQEFLRGLSPESSYRRFFTGLGRVPTEFVRRLMAVDHDRREALLALAGSTVVALADYTVLDAGAAEFGVVVADGWQRRGLGPWLLEELLAGAKCRGITRLRAHTLAENARVARLLRRRWPGARPDRDDTLLLWELPL